MRQQGLLLSAVLLFSAIPGSVLQLQAQPAKAPGPAIEYTLPKDGQVTLGLYDQQGHLLRTILSAEPRAHGRNSESWDGRDQWGRPVPAGSYLLKGLYAPPIATSYVMSFGNSGNPPWPTPDGKGDWLSDEAAPQAVASDGTWLFLGSPGSERGSAVVAVDENGHRQWGFTVALNPPTISLAVDGDYLYVLFSGPQLTDASHMYRPGGSNAIGRAVLMCVDKRTGHPAKFTINEPGKQIATFPFSGATTGLWDLRSQKSFAPANYSGMPRYQDSDVGETTSAIGLAVANQRVYVSMRDANQVLVLDANTAAKLDTIDVPAPAGLFAEPDHSILAVSEKRVVRINPATKQIQPVIGQGLDAPRCVAADQKGRIYVSDWGASFQVKMFSSTGSPLRAIGRAGGRPWIGAWETGGMLLPTGIAVDGAGRLWVAEDDANPKRVSVWNVESGAFAREFLGPAPYGGPGSTISPKDPGDATAMGTRFRLNAGAKSWTPTANIERRMDLNQPFAMNGAAPAVPGQRILYHDGHEYETSITQQHLIIHERKGDLLIPVAALGSLQDSGDGTARTVWDSDLGGRLIENYNPPFFRGHAWNNYTWTDANGDGVVQPEEMHWHKPLIGNDVYAAGSQPFVLTYWGIALGDDWSIYWSGFYKSQSFIFRLDIKGWTAAGAPIYDIADSKAIVVQSRELAPQGLFATGEGKLLATYDYQTGKAPNAVECFDRNGKSLWALAMPTAANTGHGQGIKNIVAENVIGEMHVPGLGNVLGSWLWHGNTHPYLFTDDGLYVATLLDETRQGPNAGWPESYKSYYQDPQGVPYIINGGVDAYHILKITGLEQGGRFEGQYTFTAQDVAKAASLRATPGAKSVPRPIINVTWASQPPKVDGNLSEWEMRAGAALPADKGRGAQIAIARDAMNLYLAYRVTKDRPFSNHGDNWQTLFLSGDCVDLMLATDPATASSPAAAAGDERLLLSVYRGKPVAVLYRPLAPGKSQPVQLAAARIDDIRQLASAQVAIVPSGNTYTVEAAVPLEELGLDPKAAGLALRGDAGVIYADASGNNRALRLYYYNRQTSMVSDLTTEATLQPEQWGTVQFPLGRNLLKDSSFEAGFAANADSGWFLQGQRNGAAVAMNAESPHSGLQSLNFRQIKPVVYPAASVAGADFSAFTRSANGGQGGGEAIVVQRVAVTAGHSYHLRLNYRSEGMGPGLVTGPGPDRGYATLQAAIEWTGQSVAPAARLVGVLDGKVDSPEWRQLTDTSSNPGVLMPQPYRAPAGATTAIVELRFAVNAADRLPLAYVDDIELVDTAGKP